MSEYKFEEEAYERLCQLAKDGDLVALKGVIDSLPPEVRQRFGLRTFCPEVSPKTSQCNGRYRQSPLVLAAQFGHLDVAKFFLDEYSTIIDIDYGASVVSQNSGKRIHSASALLACTLGGHVEMVKLLVSRGANVNKTSHTGSTPLRTASFHGYIAIMKCLIENGADINLPNILGESPLCIAAVRGQVKAVELLLSLGVNCNQVTIDRYTSMHLAASEGKDDVIRLLFHHGISPMFKEANPRCQDYVACPMLLAASAGHRSTVELFMEREDCPATCKSDSLLLLAMDKLDTGGTDEEIWESLEEALKIKEEKGLSTVYPEPRKEFHCHSELKTRAELQSLWNTPDFMEEGLHYQYLLIKERCLGFPYNPSFLSSLFAEGSYFIYLECHFEEGESLWLLVMEFEMLFAERQLPYLQQSYPEDMIEPLAQELSAFADGLVNMVLQGYQPQFDRFIQFGLQIVGYIATLNANQAFTVIPNAEVVTFILDFFLSWIMFIGFETDEDRKREQEAKLHQYGDELVSKHLYNPPGSTLLHVCISLDVVYHLWPGTVLGLVEALISCGADKVINKEDFNGWRPVHCAMEFSKINEELIGCLLNHGAHPDAVDSQGRNAFDTFNTGSSANIVGPLPLTCFAARKIVAEQIPYQAVDLPSHVQDFIKQHDQRCVAVPKPKAEIASIYTRTMNNV